MHSKVNGQKKVKGQHQRQTESNKGNDYLGNNIKDSHGKSYLKKKRSLKYYMLNDMKSRIAIFALGKHSCGIYSSFPSLTVVTYSCKRKESYSPCDVSVLPFII